MVQNHKRKREIIDMLEDENIDASNNDEGYNEQAQKFDDGKPHSEEDAIRAVHRKKHSPQNFDIDPRKSNRNLK